jgi:hypothetical protein
MNPNQLTQPHVDADHDKVRITRLGLNVTQDLSFEEWRSMAPRFGEAMVSAAFVIGDWLVYGEDRFRGQMRLPGFEQDQIRAGKVSPELYETALTATGLDRTTLHAYAYVARNVPRALRNQSLSWEHHKAIAKLDGDEQEHWIKIALSEEHERGGPMSTRRLRKSINAGRLLTPDDLVPDPTDRGIDNHIPWVNRLASWWCRMKASGWLKNANEHQRIALKRDLHPIILIYKEL